MSKQRSRLATAVAGFKKSHTPCRVCVSDDVKEIDRLHDTEGFGANHILFGLNRIYGDGNKLTVAMLRNHFTNHHSAKS